MKRKNVLIIGSGLAGLSCAVSCAEKGISCCLVSSDMSERAQSVLAAGGINAAVNPSDSFENHAKETYESVCHIENYDDILAMCKEAPSIIGWLEGMGAVFTRNEDGSLAQRAFGGQAFKRTCFSGVSTGKQLVSALVQKCREYEIKGLVERFSGLYFTDLLIENNRCMGAEFLNVKSNKPVRINASYVVMATGGLNGLYKRTTGSRLNDAYAASRLFEKGIRFRNLEFVQYHPTTIDAPGKKLLVSEAARGEGGRLFYIENGKRVYFMEDAYGPKGNLMQRDIVSRCVDKAPSQVYLDISFLDEKTIKTKLNELYELCLKYLGLDVTKEPIPVSSGVHFFMGGIYVDSNHKTSLDNLYAIGECASKYHGANRLGGNSLLAAVYGARKAAEQFERTDAVITANDDAVDTPFDEASFELQKQTSLQLLKKACSLSCDFRKESRGAFFRDDFPNQDENCCFSSIAQYRDGEITISYDKVGATC